VDLELNGRTAIVVASSRGIGKATALKLAQEGANVVMCARNGEELEAAAEEVAAVAGAERVLAVPTDVASLEDIQSLVARAVERFGGVEILVCSTGGPRPLNFMDISDEEWQRVIGSVLLSAIRLAREVVPHMQAAGWGRIVFITSTAAKQPLGNLVLSNATRPGIHGVAKTLATELGGSGITVNCVLPGIVRGERSEQIIDFRSEQQGRPAEEILEEVQEEIALRRRGEPHEIAAGILFLLSAQASYVTGISLSVDGGLTKSLF
jgi:3-oxoacyl-[acyl-carrier protein] reductase